MREKEEGDGEKLNVRDEEQQQKDEAWTETVEKQMKTEMTQSLLRIQQDLMVHLLSIHIKSSTVKYHIPQ